MTDQEFLAFIERNAQRIAGQMTLTPVCHGDPSRVIFKGVHSITDYLVNTRSGTVEIGADVNFGHGVMLIAATHDYHQFGAARTAAVPTEGYDIVLEEGVWLGTRVTVIGPARIGRHAVVAAGAVVVGDVEPYTVYAGVPAKKIKDIPH